MTTDRTVRLDPQELALKEATDEAVRAAGGQVFVGREVGRAQSVISDMCSRDTRSFMPINLVRKVESLGAGSPGHPHITRALARAQGVLVCEPAAEGATGEDGLHLGQWLAEIAGESGDLLRALAAGSVMPGQARDSLLRMAPDQRATIARELDQLIDVLAGFNAQFAGIDDSS